VHFQTPTYEFAVNQLGDSAATVDAYVFYNLCPPTYLSNISAPTTVSFTTVDGTAIAGVDYETLSGDITFPNPSVNYAEVPSTIGPITIHPTCIGKYFYIQLSNPRPTGETSIAYSSRIKMTGYGGSLVSLPNSQSEFAFNDSVVLTLSRGGLDTSYGLDVDVYISEINNSSNIPPSIFEFTDPINYGISGIAPNRTWPYRVSWFAGDTAPKTLTFGDPAETTDGKTGYYRARLEKVSLTDNVLFDPHPYTQVLYLANNSLYYSGSVVGAIDTPITVSLSYTGITYVRGKNLTTMTSMTIIWGSLEKVDITNAPICNTIFLYNNLLPSFDISPFPLAASVVLNDNLLTQAAVDDILVKLAAGSVYGGYVDLSNYYGPGNAIPSATGLSAKATLESRGWTVTVQT
jgi:hypothetical protein